jgi:hypothetical protein
MSLIIVVVVVVSLCDESELTLHAVMNKYTVAFIIVVSGFMDVGETMTATAQDYINETNSTKLDKQKIIVTWLETNDTKTSDTPVTRISNEHFWKILEPLLLKQSINGSTSSSE